MAKLEFFEFLHKRVEAARLDFLEAKYELEQFEMEWGSQAYVGAWQRKDQELSDVTHKAYEAYKKAWVEWYAATNGYALHPARGQKDTPAFATPVPLSYQRVQIVNGNSLS